MFDSRKREKKKIGKKETIKKMNINFFTCLIINEKLNSFSFI